MTAESSPSFLARNEFLLRRLHSLSGLIPVGAYMCVHLLTNATVLNSSATFQKAVYQIHSLESALPIVEWVFIFIPLLFHAIFGVVIVRGGLPNSGTYKYSSNIRYTLQRASGMVAFAFIMWHVFHMHGWLHFDAWLAAIKPVGGGSFKAYNAASTAALALRQSGIIPILYTIGILSCVFHLANGIWTFGITWGIWVSPAAQKWATSFCIVFGLALGAVGMSALGGFTYGVNVDEARKTEDKMYEANVASGAVTPNAHKRVDEHGPAETKETKPAAEAAAKDPSAPAPETTSTEASAPATGG